MVGGVTKFCFDFWLANESASKIIILSYQQGILYKWFFPQTQPREQTENPQFLV